ncbi:MAG: cbb3-type cytochrome c oxidase subunit I, partial [Niabella sp.]
PLLSEGGIIITILLLLIPVVAALVLMIVRIKRAAGKYISENNIAKAKKLASFINDYDKEMLEKAVKARKAAADYQLTHQELSGALPAVDERGLLFVKDEEGLPFVAQKQKAPPRASVDPQLSRLVLAYLVSATVWLLFGTTIGEYVGIKFVAPDADHVSWLSFGRLRPVHTNAVFWGWASLAMLGLAYYVVPRVGNEKLYSYKLGWYSLHLTNATVLIGTILLMAGINNGGGEYREYIWPVMSLFAIALVLTLYNFLKTVAARKTKEIYISNWYIISAIIYALVIVFVAYWPTWQNGLGETIIQGYYMHQGVGMWFMFFTLGLVYYYLPQQLNRPIYSYSLGILAFWTQILFYTLIGTHHFVFSPIPWWLQTVAIFGSVGMVIPVVAGTTNFLMTFKNGWYKLADSYTLPFFLVGTIFYFTGSLQGTAEAFRSTNLIWHFTDFTVAHSHLTMYGIISFFLWACIYTIVPRFTQNEAPQWAVGTHFWLALIGLLFYTVPLMYGSTLKGQMWIEGKPFIESVVQMAPHWLWRAIGGSLMWISHIFFAYNLYKMMPAVRTVDVNDKAIEILQAQVDISAQTKSV